MSFRIDRLATLLLFSPVRRRTIDGNSLIPILMYHSIADDDDAQMHPYYKTTTSPRVFREHMQELHDRGYSTVSLDEAVAVLQGGIPTSGRVVITFDDGYSDFYRHAFPELSRHKFTATVFLPTAYIGNQAIQFKGRDCLTWTEVRELRKYGTSFGSHTVTHPQLSSLEARTVKDELVNSKQTIEQNLGESVNSFAYPFAFPETRKSFVAMLRHTLVDCGYSNGVSTCIGTARPHEDQYFLRRLPMNSLDDGELFAAKLQGGYDWLHKVQYASKRLRADL
jgi:hypothetical protein